VNDDFRLTIELAGEHGRLDELLERVREGEVEYEASNRLGDRVVVSRGDDRIFVYAGSAEEAQAAGAAVLPLLPRFNLAPGEPRLERWHPEAEEWRDGDAPLPTSPAEHAAEQAKARERERAESAAAGHPEWEVRIELGDADAARALEEQLEGEGLDVQRRSHYVLAGAPSEDDAKALAERLRAEAPPGARLEVQGTGQEWWAVLHPFSVFGGLGG
jgi:hypothetical protein